MISLMHGKNNNRKILTYRKRAEWWLPGAGGGANGKMLIKVHKLSVIK